MADDERNTKIDPTGSTPPGINADSCLPAKPMPSSSLVQSTIITGINGGNHKDDNSNTTKTFRQQIGIQLADVSDFINDNLIVVRYATFSTIILLGAYGIASSPLFYRYKHVMEIPQQMFKKRKYLHGRIVGVITENEGFSAVIRGQPNQTLKRPLSISLQGSIGSDDSYKADSIQHQYRPIVVLFRHSSPMERLLSQSAMKTMLSSSDKSSSTSPYHNLLPIELAGVSAPPYITSSIMSTSSSNNLDSSQVPLLNQLIQQKSKVSIQLLAQRITSEPQINTDANRREIPGSDIIKKNKAICHLHYQPPTSWFKYTNASLEMVQRGQACIHPNGMIVSLSNSPRNHTIVRFEPTVKQLHDDTRFLSKLERAEYSSWKSKVGMWALEDYRCLRTEYLEEEEMLKNKWHIWSLVKRGWEWMRR